MDRTPLKSSKIANKIPHQSQLNQSYAKSRTKLQKVLFVEQNYEKFIPIQHDKLQQQIEVSNELSEKQRLIRLECVLRIQSRALRYNDLFNPIDPNMLNPQNQDVYNIMEVQEFENRNQLQQIAMFVQNQSFVSGYLNKQNRINRFDYEVKIEEEQTFESYKQYDSFGEITKTDSGQQLASMGYYQAYSINIAQQTLNYMLMQKSKAAKQLQVVSKEIQFHTEKKKKSNELSQKLEQKKLSNKELQKEYNYIRSSNSKIKCQICVSMLQLSNTVYRFGTTINVSEVKKGWILDPNYQQGRMDRRKGFGLQDLLIFIKMFLYPMVVDIFRDFPSHSTIYKFMFGGFDLTQKEKENNHVILGNSIHKYLKRLNYNNLEECLHNGVQKKKKKIVILCSQLRYKQIKQALKSDIVNFFNQAILINKVCFINYEEKYKQTQFQKEQLVIEYLYEKKKIITKFQILHQDPYFLKRAHMDQLLKNRATKAQPIFFWLQIPKFVKKQSFPDFKDIYSLLHELNYSN